MVVTLPLAGCAFTCLQTCSMQPQPCKLTRHRGCGRLGVMAHGHLTNQPAQPLNWVSHWDSVPQATLVAEVEGQQVRVVAVPGGSLCFLCTVPCPAADSCGSLIPP